MNKPTILIVDDEAKFLKSLELLLKRDFNVLTALNGQEGLDLLESNPSTSLILLDLDMPVMNGVEMLKKLRESGNDIKVLIMTGNSTHEWARQCAKFAVCGYIDKPIDPEKLIEEIKKLLGVMECKVFKEIWGDKYHERIASLSHLVRSIIRNVKIIHGRKLTRSDIAKKVNVSPTHLSHAFHKECGIQFRDYLNMCKIFRSKKYLVKSEKISIKEVASNAGISSPSHFIKLFKKYIGCTPNEYRKKHSV